MKKFKKFIDKNGSSVVLFYWAGVALFVLVWSLSAGPEDCDGNKQDFWVYATFIGYCIVFIDYMMIKWKQMKDNMKDDEPQA